MNPIGRLGWIQVDAREPERLAAFWGAVLGKPVSESPLGDPAHYLGLEAASDDLVVCFQRVPDSRASGFPQLQDLDRPEHAGLR